MSAAVALGRPFVLTKVAWNGLNIQTYAGRLSFRAPKEKQKLIEAVFLKTELERAGELEGISDVFEATGRAIPTLTDTMLREAGSRFEQYALGGHHD